MPTNKFEGGPNINVGISTIECNNGSSQLGLYDLKALVHWLAQNETHYSGIFRDKLRDVWPVVEDLIYAAEPDLAWEDPLEKGLSLTESVDRIFKTPKMGLILTDIIKRAVEMDSDDSRQAGNDFWTAPRHVRACAIVLLSYLHALCYQEHVYLSTEGSKRCDVTTTVEPIPINSKFTWEAYAKMTTDIDLSFVQFPYRKGPEDGYYMSVNLQMLVDMKEFIPMILSMDELFLEDTLQWLDVHAKEESDRCRRGTFHDFGTELRKVMYHLWKV